MTSNEIRKSFIDFFSKKHKHTFVPSSPVVPLDDPTLLFTNAGMNQFKPYFLGSEKAPWSRVVNTQKCIRAGGKHNDLDDVGRSRRHHTFFEMLGNWSFGDYFKEGAIKMAWELLVHIWKLDPTRIHVSCYEGDEQNGVPRDNEAADIWHKFIGVPKDHIHWGGKDNFWEMGETGPCGPCTEIFYDRTPEKSGGKSVLSGEDPRVMEIWNNVFIQYNRNPDRSLTKLPAQHVDTGMGFERICQVLQGKNDNYGIDLFDPIFEKISKLSGKNYGGIFPESDLGDRSNESPELKRDIAFRVIADHARMATFAITDGAKPDNKGRDSVVRSVIRRAVRFGYQQFGLRKPFLNQLVPVIADAMGETFPELRNDPKRVAKIIESEETSFLATIERGLGLFEEAIERANLGGTVGTPPVEQRDSSRSSTGGVPTVAPGKIIDPKASFDLHTTFGFPIDLQEQMALERGVKVDRAGYEKLFEEFQAKSGEGRKKHVTVAVDLGQFAETDDSPKYSGRETSGTILGWIIGDQPTTSGKLGIGAEGSLLLDKTNFYAEQGGQIGDVGHIEIPTGKFLVADTERRGKHVLHWGRVETGSIEVGQSAKVIVDRRRADIMRNHTATHLMNHAMRRVLGEHVEQRGSLVDSEKLRFDFSHDKALSAEEIEKIERIVNEAITHNIGVKAETIPLEQAKKIKGVRAVFGEKYPDPVRVVCVSEKTINELDATESSVEFCGGTHVTRTGDIGFFKITAEESLSKGIRRITAVTGIASSNYVRQLELITRQIAQNLSTTIEEAPRRIEALQAEIKQLKKKLASGGSGLPSPAQKSEELLKGALDASGAKVVIARIDGATSDYLMSLMDSIRKHAPSHALMLAGVEDEKINFLSAVSDDLIKKGLKAGDWIREVAKVAGGGGGGRPNMAQAGGKDVLKADEALALAKVMAVGVIGS
ncbi:MAG TPA: alanine--tRNA ligase [Tepidisphaeraceae bacterium]|nr:alanine--tRNA ligase [Tepidisphaeraceae bacterium]